MAYKEKYALDITPQGDTVRESIKKNRDEILEVAKNIDLKSGGGATGLRNRVLTGKISNGQFSFLSGDSLGVIIDGTQTPLIVSFAEGFNEYGAVDYIISVTGKVSAWTLLPNKTQYLYIERSNAGAISYGSTTVLPVRKGEPPESILNAMYYNDLVDRMYVYNGTQWEAVQRVFVAIVTTDSTSVREISYYTPTINQKLIENNSVTNDKLADASVTARNISDGEVKTKHIGDEQVTKEKLSADVKKYITDGITNVTNDFNSHKDDLNAHKSLFDKCIKNIEFMNGALHVEKGTLFNEPIDIITNNEEDTFGMGASVSLVKSLINRIRVKDDIDVARALKNQSVLNALGISYQIYDVNNWYIKLGSLFGDMIVQGGSFPLNRQSEQFPKIMFPTAFNNSAYYLGFSVITGPASNYIMDIDASVLQREVTKEWFKYEVHSRWDEILDQKYHSYWIALGK